ncbi:MAG: tetratricopeptide repeat protein [Candidatus Thiodiazotropha sp. (ex. Lucinisca nassula)]|nr:tetratricopeptide repeat protein [Candidatus Thiodiazotropha sp. (ex. Lucinisca nassula)]
MPKFSVLTWLVIIVAQVTYGLLVYAITRSYYEDTSVTTSQLPAASPESATHPQVGSFDAVMQPAVKFQPSSEAPATDDPALIARLADDYFMRKEYPQAIELYERALRINPDDVESYNDLGLSLFYIGQSQRAVEVLQTGASKQPDFQRIQLTLGFVQAQTGNKEAAFAAFNRAIELGPENTVGQEARRMLNEIE